MVIPEAERNAIIAGVLALVLGVAAQFRWARLTLPFLFLIACGVLTRFKMLDRGWALESLRLDASWGVGVPLIAWTMIAALGLIRLSGWPATVLIGAVLGDRFAAMGLVLGEADTGRRARLVLAASGASLIGLTGGPAALVLGFGGWRTAVLGGVLALVGWAGPPLANVVREPGLPRQAGLAVLSGVIAVLAGWILMVGGSADLIAQGIEEAPLFLPRAWKLTCFAGAVLAGVITDEGVAAMAAHATFERGLDLMTSVPKDVVRVGIAVGGGLPLLLLTGSRLRVGVPLWLCQVAIAAMWAQWFVT